MKKQLSMCILTMYLYCINRYYKVEIILMLLYVSAALYMGFIVLLLYMIVSEVCGMVPAVFIGGI